VKPSFKFQEAGFKGKKVERKGARPWALGARCSRGLRFDENLRHLRELRATPSVSAFFGLVPPLQGGREASLTAGSRSRGSLHRRLLIFCPDGAGKGKMKKPPQRRFLFNHERHENES